MFLAITCLTAFGQLSGTKNIPGDYATIEAAIADLNTQGVVAPGVTFVVASGHTETFTTPVAGLITATGTNPNDQIIFQAATGGIKPVITAATGVSTTLDGIIIIRGGDYITFDGIDLQENPANTTATQQMEWGYALLKVSATDGAQNNVIKNCAVSLNKANANTACIYSNNHTTIATTALTVTAASGTNSNNKFYGNTLTNAFNPIFIVGFNDAAYTLFDQNNEIGVTAANNISDFGGNATNYGIYVRYNNLVKISNNAITTSGPTSTTRGIYLGGTTNASAEVNNNTISLTSASTTSLLAAIESAYAGASANVNIYANIIQNCSYPTATSGTFYGIYNNTTTVGNLSINNNLITGNTLNGTGAMTLIDGGGGAVVNITNNNVNGNSKTGASGTMYGIRAGTSVLLVQGNTIHSNSITANSGTSASNIYGIYNLSSPTQESYLNNSVYNLTITGATSSATNILYGIYSNTLSSSVINANGNEIYGLSFTNSSTGSVAINGIRFALGTTINVSSNKIYNFSAEGASSSVDGIRVAGGTTWNVYNNYISDLKTPLASSNIAVNGVYVAGGTTARVYYNTIYINAASTGTNFGTSGIYASITPTVDLRNNIIVNTSTPSGTGLTVAYRRSAAGVTTHATTSNNNDFYAGTPSATNVIFYDGTSSDQTIVDFQTRVSPKENLSFSVMPPFVNIATTPYDLHLQTTVSTMCESGGQQITTPAITTDYDGDVRFGETGYTGGGSATDVGADEFNGIPSYTCAAPAPGNTVASNNPVCLGELVTLSMQNTTAGTGVVYQWQSSPDGSTWTNISSATGSSYVFTPGTTMYYQCVVTCLNGPSTATSNPVQITFTNNITSTTPGTRCGAGSVSLSANASMGSTITWYDVATGGTSVGTGSPFTTPVISATNTFYAAAEVFSPVNAIIGTGTNQNTTTTYPCPYGNYYENVKSQYLIRASELSAAGLTAGNLNSVSFDVASLGTSGIHNDYTISIANTALTTLTTSFVNAGFTTVYGPMNYQPVAGANTHTFTTPFMWDGVSNIIIDICFTNDATASGVFYTVNAITNRTATSFVSAITASADNVAQCGATTGTTASIRPNMVFAGTGTCSSPRVPVVATVTSATEISLTASQTVCNNAVATISVTSTLSEYDSYVWTPEANLFTDAACTTPYVSGASATTVYLKTNVAGDYALTCTANNSSTLCSDIETSTITVIPGTVTISASPDVLCVIGTPTISATPATGWGTATFQWWASEDGTNFSFTGATNLTETATIDTTTWAKLLVYVGGNLCFESAVGVITVNDPQVLSTTPGTRCGTGTVNLSATGSAGTTLVWYDAATGGNEVGTGNTLTTPSISATTDFYVAAGQISGTIGELVGNMTVPGSVSSSSSSDAGILFNTTVNNIPIQSARILVSGTGNITFQLQDNAGTPISSYVAPITGATSAAFTTVNFPASFITGVAATGYRLLATGKDAGITWYYQTGAYPYNSSDGALSITGGWGWGSPTSNATDLRCIHNITIPVPNLCESARVAVTATVTTPPAITVTATPATICFGESSDLLVTSANTDYTYTWSTGAVTANSTVSPLSSAIYTVSASDVAGCVNVGIVDVTVNPNPMDALAGASQTIVTCGTAIDLTSSPASEAIVTLMEEDFNATTNSWVTVNNSTGGTPADAEWTLRADGYVYGGTTFHSNDNSQFYMTNSDDQGSGGTTITMLESPSFSTMGLSTLNLSFYQYYRHLTGGFGKVEVWDGNAWNEVFNNTVTDGTAAVFVQKTLDISAYTGLTDVKIRFNYYGSYAWYWAIDNVLVEAETDAVDYAWTSAPAGFTSTLQNITGVTPLVSTDYTVVLTNTFGCTSSSTVSVAVNALAAPVLTVVDNCGSTSISASGYTGTLTWSTSETTPSITVTTAGNYSAYYTDGSCVSEIAMATATPVAVPDMPGATSVSVCQNVTIPALTATGTGTINWYDDAMMTNLVNTGSTFNTGMTSVGTYTYYVNATENGCTGPAITVALEILTAPMATISASANPSACGLSDGSATATGGSTYLWGANAASQTTATATGLAAGVYYVTVYEGTCFDVNSVTLTDPGAPTVILLVDNSYICPGTTATFTGTGATEYEFFINGVSQGAASTNAIFTTNTIQDGDQVICNGSTSGCTGVSAPINMTVYIPETVTFEMPWPVGTQYGQDTLCWEDVNYTLTGVNPTGGVFSGTGVTAGEFNPINATPGTWTVITYTYDDANGCVVTAMDSVYTDICLGASLDGLAAGISVYPNPSNGVVYVKSASPVHYQVTSVDGRLIRNNDINRTESVLDMSDVAKGVYFIRFSNDAETYVYRIVIE
jgi:hypothetical protein